MIWGILYFICTVICCGKYFEFGMKEWCGEIMTILEVDKTCYIMKEDGGRYLWTDEMIEGAAVEFKMTAPTIMDGSIFSDKLFKVEQEIVCPEDYEFFDEMGNIIKTQRVFIRKKKKEYTKGTKVRHKTKGMVETVVGVCKIKYMGAWVDGVIYEGNDTNTGDPTTFVRIKEDFENNFEICKEVL